MGCFDAYLDDPSEIPSDWLDRVRETLLANWTSKTGHSAKANAGTWACEIAVSCRTCNEHLSLPCSLLSEANEIAVFLGSSCFSSDPAIFLRIYLIILSEFVAQLESVGKMMNLKLGKKPRSVSLWANRWSKHRLQILLQHHPLLVFADQYGDRWVQAEQRYRCEPFNDGRGNLTPVKVIDSKWLERDQKDRLLIAEANAPGQALVIVPPLTTFLDETILFFREFLDGCLADPEKIRRFESSHYKSRR